MNVFVTGGTGFLGNNLIRQLLGRGYTVRALARTKEKAQTVLKGLEVEVVEGDMQHIPGFAARLEGCDLLFHTAAYFSEYFQPGDHWPMLKAVNVSGTVRLLEIAERAGVRRAVHTSSDGVIGVRADGSGGDESTPPSARQLQNLYFKSKFEADLAVAHFLKGSRLEVVTVMPGWMHGPGDAAPTEAGKLVLQLLGRKLPGLLDGGGSTVDVRDVARGMIAAAEHGINGDRYILGGRYVSFEELAATLTRVTGVPTPKLVIPPTVLETLARVAERFSALTKRPSNLTLDGVRTLHLKLDVSSERAARDLGVSFRPLAETLRDAVAWFETNGYLGPSAAGPYALSS